MMRANGLFAEEKVKPFRGKATKGGRKNDFLRKVMCTGRGSQLVALSIPPGQEIGDETQVDSDQTLFIVAGQGEAVLDGNVKPVRQHNAVFAPAGTKRNLRNKGHGRLKLFTVYSRLQSILHFLTRRVLEQFRARCPL
jgi:mannose-6-phosphate isomerase-like protein (cupin superfamily)